MGLRWAYVFLAAATTVVSVVAGDDYYDGFPAGDLVKGLPGQPISTAPFRQYAGYVDVDVENRKSFFYYFVESQKNPREAPLTLWSNGGPSCSSIGGGAFTELGPFFPSGDGRSLVVNSKSWNLVSNLLFVDYPAGVGWSYSNKSSDYSTKDETTSRDMFNFMLGWYGKFPSFRTRVLFLAGESYAGHYVPQLAYRILSHNHSHHYFNLQGIAIGNPTLKVNRDIPAMYAYFWSHGLISDEIYRKITEQCDFEVYSYAGTENKTQFPCIKSLIKAYESVGNAYADIYGVIYDKCYPAIVEQELQHGRTATKMSYGVDVCKMYETSFYLNLPDVQKALHANRTKLPYKWSDCTGHSILKYKLKDKDTNMLPLLKEILDRRLRVWIYSGDQDSIVPLSGTRTCVRELAGDLKFNISVPYGPWFHEQQVGGWQIEYGNLLTFATVKGGAHMVPYTQPSKALHLFTTFVLGLRLPNTTNIN